MSDRPEPILTPAVTAAVIGSLTSVLALLVAFGVNVSTEQQAAILGVATSGLGLGGALVTVLLALRARAKVTPLEDPQNIDGLPLSPQIVD